jgi:hypothetical protein
MAASQLFGVSLCSNSLLRINSAIKISPKQYKTKIDNLTYFINLYGLGPNTVPNNAIDFAVSQL